MSMSEAVEEAVELGRSALGISEWQRAYESLKAVEEHLPPEGLSLLSLTAYWTARTEESLAVGEAAYQAFVAIGDYLAAGRQALELGRDYSNSGESAVGAAWFSKAGRHLEGAKDCPEEALALYFKAVTSFDSGDFDEARKVLEETVAVADRFGDSSLSARARMLHGITEVQAGNSELGVGLLGEASASVTAGAVDPKTAGVVMCNTIGTCWDIADFKGASEWTNNATRWFERNDIPGIPGICRVRRAEIMTLRGDWDKAKSELHRAGEELERYEIVEYVAEVKYALGQIQLYRGDINEAVSSFKEANQLGKEPVPGLALVAASQGKRDTAIATLKQALTGPDERIPRSRVLLPLVELLVEAGEVDEAQEVSAELAALADECKTGAMRAWSDTAKAACLAASNSVADAVTLLDGANRIWEELKVPYEAASTRLRRGLLRQQLGENAGAELDFEAARATFEKLGASPDLERMNRMLNAETAIGLKPRAIMVTDIVGSTRLAEAMGDQAWTKLLTWHDHTLVDCIRRHNGGTIDRTGDGYLVTFDGVAAAIACAIEIQQALDQQRADHGFAPGVRIGIHTADITEIDGSPAGAEVHRAARIGALAGADEILISRQVSEVLDDSHPVDDWHSEQIKGFDQPVDVGHLTWRTDSTTPH
ncbi:MAG: adenylate/guanylate cyclase domain-containing protein [Acidimicrobiia bacterium]